MICGNGKLRMRDTSISTTLESTCAHTYRLFILLYVPLLCEDLVRVHPP